MTSLNKIRSASAQVASNYHHPLESFAVTVKSIPSGESFSIDVISAKVLHAFLEVDKDFSKWIEKRIKKYSFIENQDYIEYAPRGFDPEDYFISLDIAAFLARMERTDKGREVMQYLECKKKLITVPAPTTHDLVLAARAWADGALRTS